jgi:drug/metabolite transporter (DMT)-like permease
VVVTLALTAALCFAAASVLQQRAAAAAPSEHTMRIGLLTHLVRRPIWLAGTAADAGGYLLQVMALDRGPLALVQPLLAGGLLFALLFNTSPGSRGLRRQDWVAALVIALGLAVFVIAGDPKGSATGISGRAWTVFAAVSVFAIGALILLSSRGGAPRRAALLALSAGVAFGLSAALTKQSVNEFHSGVVHLVRTGYPYALIGAGIWGTLLTQSAFQVGALAASLPTLTLSEPIFATVAGVLLFGEHIRSGAAGFVAAAGGLVAAGAVIVLTRSPRAHPAVAP